MFVSVLMVIAYTIGLYSKSLTVFNQNISFGRNLVMCFDMIMKPRESTRKLQLSSVVLDPSVKVSKNIMSLN